MWDLANSTKPIATFLHHDAPVTNLRYNPVDKALASGGNDRTVKYWDLDSFTLVIFWFIL
jgi:katanin p80 WD40 repeat-containing subunit B1